MLIPIFFRFNFAVYNMEFLEIIFLLFTYLFFSRESVHAPQQARRGQRTMCWSWFIPLPRGAWLGRKCFYLLNHLTGSSPLSWNVVTWLSRLRLRLGHSFVFFPTSPCWFSAQASHDKRLFGKNLKEGVILVEIFCKKKRSLADEVYNGHKKDKERKHLEITSGWRLLS